MSIHTRARCVEFLRGTTKKHAIAIVLASLVLVSAGGATRARAEESGKPLTEGWNQSHVIAEWKVGDRVIAREGLCELRVERGWLTVARFSTPDKALEWQVVLARAEEKLQPVVKIDPKNKSLEITYGRHFIRDTLGRLRILREAKTAESPEWSIPAVPKAIEKGSAGNLRGVEANDWIWALSAPEGRPDLWMRIQHQKIADKGMSFRAIAGTPSVQTLVVTGTPQTGGDHTVQDEGDLFVATRATPEIVEHLLRAAR
jgi:hypothetical protein